MNEETRHYVQFLDNLRESGVTNMFGAAPYLVEQFEMSRERARRILSEWMKLDLSLPVQERADKIDAAMR